MMTVEFKWSLFVFMVSCPFASLFDDPIPNSAVLNMLLERLIKSTDNLDERLGILQENFEKLDQRLNEQNDQIMTLSERMAVIESTRRLEQLHPSDQIINIENLEKQLMEQENEIGNLKTDLQADMAQEAADHRHQLTVQRRGLFSLKRQLLSSQKTFIDKIDTIDSNMQTCIDKKIVSFSARVKPSISNIGAYRTIKFASIETNIGNAYDSTSGEFTAPLAGVYVFFATILAKPKNYIETVLKVNDEDKLWLYSGDANYHGPGSNLLVSHLSKGDKVKMTTYISGTKPFYIHHYWSTFSGFLIDADRDDELLL